MRDFRSESSAASRRVLLVVSDPLDLNLAPLNSSEEIECVRSVLESASLPTALTVLRPPTLHKLNMTLLSMPFSILHFIGHGHEEGIWLETDRGQADFVRARDLAVLIRQADLPLVVLSACNSWETACILANEGAKAVVASKEFLPDTLVPQLMGVLYSAIVGGHSIVESVSAANRALSRSFRDPSFEQLSVLGRLSGSQLKLAAPSTRGHACSTEETHVFNLNFSLVDKFVNRKRELTGPIYDYLVSPGYRAIALVGLAGIGKSTLAAAAATRFGWMFNGGVVRVDFDEQTQPGLEVLVRTLEKLFPDWNIGRGAIDVRALRALCGLEKNRVLLILDNLDSVPPNQRQTISHFLAHWDNRKGGRALLTMRERLPEFDSVIHDAFLSVESMDPGSTIELFRRHTQSQRIRKSVDEKSHAQIASWTHGHPLTIRLTAGFLAGKGTWDEVTEKQNVYASPYGPTYQVLDSMIPSLSTRDETVPHLLRTWSVFDGGATSDAWESITRISLQDSPLRHTSFQPGVEILRRAELFDRDQTGRYSIHPLVGEYIKTRVWDPLPGMEKAQIQKSHANYFATYVSNVTGETARRLTLLDQEYANVRVALQNAWDAQDWSSVKHIARNIYKYLDVRGYWDDQEETMCKGMQASNKTNDEEHATRFIYYKAQLCQRRGQWEQARQYLDEAHLRAKAEGCRDILARITGVSARLLRLQGQLEEADLKYQESLAELRSIGDWGRVAILLGELVDLTRQWGNFERMRIYALEAYRIEKEVLHGVRAWGLATAEMQLGKLATEENDFEKAAELFSRALPVLQIGDASRWLYAELLHAMGLLKLKHNDPEGARLHFREALEVAESLRDAYRVEAILWDLEKIKRC